MSRHLLRFGLLDFLVLAALVAAAGALRVGYLYYFADQAGSDGPLLVQDPPPKPGELVAARADFGSEAPTELDALVHNLKATGEFKSPAPLSEGEELTAHVAPGYPYLLAQAYTYLDEADAPRVVRWTQAGLGALTVGLYYLFARRAFQSQFVALLVGLFTAAYPFWIINTAARTDGVVTTFTLALALYLGTRAGQSGGPFTSLLFGLSLAALALLRASLLPFAVVGLLWFLLRSRMLRGGWLYALLAFLGLAGGLSAWVVRNLQVFDEPVPVVTSVNLHLWLGNNPAADGAGRHDPAAMPGASGDEKGGVGLSKLRQPDRYGRFGKAALEDLDSDHLRALRTRVRTVLSFLLGSEFTTNGELAYERTSAEKPDEGGGEVGAIRGWVWDHHTEILSWSLLAMLPLAFLGWRWTYAWRENGALAALATIWLPLPYLLSHAEVLHGPRLPLDGVLLCYAAFALGCFVPGVAGRLFHGPRDVPPPY